MSSEACVEGADVCDAPSSVEIIGDVDAGKGVARGGSFSVGLAVQAVAKISNIKMRRFMMSPYIYFCLVSDGDSAKGLTAIMARLEEFT